MKIKPIIFTTICINLSNFSVNNLKLDKKTWKYIDIYFIGYDDKSKPSDWKVNSAFCFVGEKNGIKYLSIDKGDTLKIWNQVFSGIKNHTKKVSHECKEFSECKGFPDCEECKVDYDDDFNKIKFVSSDLLPLGKLIYFPTLTVVIRCVIKQNDIYYPQV